MPVNCGAIPSELMESEFFGHKRGSFTGAVTDKMGLIPSAEGGTLFLDEVADLPLHMQVKLLRVIQEKTVRPDRRAARSAHRRAHPLGDAQESRRPGGAGEIPRRPVLPHQRDRAARAGAARARRRHSGSRRRHRAPPVAAPRHRRAGRSRPRRSSVLQNFAFPGNVRELENVLERALALCNDGRIDVGDLQLRAVPRAEDAPPLAAEAIARLRAGAAERPGRRDHASRAALGEQLEDVERAAIIKALEQARYNKTAAAKALGMTFRALRYRIKKLGIE